MKSHLRTAAFVVLLPAILLAAILLPGVGVAAPPAAQTMPLWENGPPDDNGLSGDEKRGACTGNISEPTLTVHLPSPEMATGAAVVITPGGGYRVVCDDTEGRQIAELLVARGIAAFVLKYRLPNGHHRVPANDARRAIRTVRHRAAEWKVDPQRVGIWGFSAGGHLASTVSTAFDAGDAAAGDPIEQQSSRPDFSILFYPVVSFDLSVAHRGSRANLLGDQVDNETLIRRYCNDQQITENTPPAFLLHAADDKAVHVDNSLRYYRALLEHGIPARLLVFETGGHGPTAFQQNPSWLPVFESWLKTQRAM